MLGLGTDRSILWREDAAKALVRRPARPFSVIFIDPPYQEPLLNRILAALTRNGWLAPGAIVNAEVERCASFRADVPGLSTLTDRPYGQTRILLWTANSQAA
jgi:16S rRNA (guanine966-N2)-methyltransferase